MSHLFAVFQHPVLAIFFPRLLGTNEIPNECLLLTSVNIYNGVGGNAGNFNPL